MHIWHMRLSTKQDTPRKPWFLSWKFDFAKAYDRIVWEFLFLAMMKISVANKSVSKIKFNF
jgi:hypothetical protein